jgi:hypothetical protein
MASMITVEAFIRELEKYNAHNVFVRFVQLEPMHEEGNEQKFGRINPLELAEEHPFTIMRNEDDTLRVQIRLVSSTPQGRA